MKYTYELNIQGKPIKNIIIEIKIIMFKVSESIINSFPQFLHIIKVPTLQIDDMNSYMNLLYCY
jgi:hypothetical protein